MNSPDWLSRLHILLLLDLDPSLQLLSLLLVDVEGWDKVGGREETERQGMCQRRLIELKEGSLCHVIRP